MAGAAGSGRQAAARVLVDVDPSVLAYALAQDEASSTFDGWLRAGPAWVGERQANWDWPHLRIIREHLDRVALALGIEQPGVTGPPIRRLIITCPSQHGKSSIATVRFPVWCLARRPRMPILVGSYNEKTALKFSAESRDLARDWVSFSDAVDSKGEWQTTVGGGIVSVGTTGGTGRPARLFIADDLLKDAADADSFQRREQVWRWITQVLYTRRPDAAILVATRWHPDDPTGRLLALNERLPESERFVHLHLKLLAEEGDVLEREVGEPLCPELESKEVIEAWRAVDPYAFELMGQGDTEVPREGAHVQVEKMELVDPEDVPADLDFARGWDIARSESPKADASAGVRLGRSRATGMYYVFASRYGRWEPATRNQHILETAKIDGREVPIWLPSDPVAGKDVELMFTQLLDGFSFTFSDVLARDGARPQAKFKRAEPWIVQINAGKVRIVRGGWEEVSIEQFIHEHRQFSPTSKTHDDLVDAASLAHAALSGADMTPAAGGVVGRAEVTQPTRPGGLSVGRFSGGGIIGRRRR